jgi:hypothetical protein
VPSSGILSDERNTNVALVGMIIIIKNSKRQNLKA